MIPLRSRCMSCSSRRPLGRMHFLISTGNANGQRATTKHSSRRCSRERPNVRPFYFATRLTDDGEKTYLVDDVRRFRALVKFVLGKKQVSLNDVPFTFDELPEEYQSRFLSARGTFCMLDGWTDEEIVDHFESMQKAKP